MYKEAQQNKIDNIKAKIYSKLFKTKKFSKRIRYCTNNN